MVNMALLISIGGFAINLGLLIWRMSALNSKVLVAEKRVEEISSHFREYRKEVRGDIDKLTDKFDVKLSMITGEINKKLEEMQGQLNNVSIVIARIETKLNG